MELISELKGFDGKLYVYDDRIVISRNTLAGIVLFGSAKKTFFYNSIQGVEIINGIFRIIPMGAESNAKKFNKDSNVITLGFNRKHAKKIYNLILQKIKEANNGGTKSNSISKTDEILKFKKLLDDGIITNEEFEIKKQELLK